MTEKLGLKTAQLMDRATEQGRLLFSGDKHAVTPKGEKAGVEFVAKAPPPGLQLNLTRPLRDVVL